MPDHPTAVRGHSGGAGSRPSARVVLTIAAGLALAACGGDGPVSPLPGEQRSTDQLNLLSVTADAPALTASTASVWAVKGRNAQIDLWYHARPGRSDSTKFLEFKVPGDGLDRLPDGTAIPQGDSVQITVTVTDPAHLVVEFQPSGLRFAADKPAELRIRFAECGSDLNDDGQVNGQDDAIAAQLSFWRREQPADPWVKQPSVVVKSASEVEAKLGGFTGYAISY